MDEAGQVKEKKIPRKNVVPRLGNVLSRRMLGKSFGGGMGDGGEVARWCLGEAMEVRKERWW